MFIIIARFRTKAVTSEARSTLVCPNSQTKVCTPRTYTGWSTKFVLIRELKFALHNSQLFI